MNVALLHSAIVGYFAGKGDLRLDANESAFLERQLTYLRSQVHDVQYAELMARRFVPIANDIPSDADTYSYEVNNRTGEAKVLANQADDLPRVDVQASEVTGKVKTIGDSYGWYVQQLRSSIRLGKNLPSKKLMAASLAIETKIDEMLGLGHAASNITGLVNNADVVALGIINPANDPWNYTTTTADAACADLDALVNTIVLDSLQLFKPDTLLLAPAEYNFLATKKRSDSSDVTVLRWFLNNNPYIRNVDQWYRLTAAGAGGKNRAVCYKRDPMILEGIIPQEFEALPPQERNLELVVPCHARCGGVAVYQPQAVRYADFTATTMS